MEGRRLRPWGRLLVAGGALGLAALQAGGASAAHVARIDIRPGQAASGTQIAISGPPGWAPSPVSIRWNGLDGEVLGTFPTTAGANASFGPGTITIPNVAPGTYELVGTQDVPETQAQVRGVPARARITVTGPGGAVPAAPAQTRPLQRLETLKESSPSTPTLVLLGLGAFALTVGAGLVAAAALRRRAVAS